MGDATTFPIAALYSDTARALAMERFIKPPMIPPSWAYRFILKASPPVSPDSERVSGMDPAWIACRITCKFSRIRWYSTSSRELHFFRLVAQNQLRKRDPCLLRRRTQSGN